MTIVTSPYWHQWYESQIGWHVQENHPFLIKYGDRIIPNFERSCNASQEIATRIFVPLCGKTVDMAFLASHPGVQEVVGIDGVRKALLEFSRENTNLKLREVDPVGPVERFLGEKITLLRGDYFDLDNGVTQGRFDAVFDRASMVAIRPELREKVSR